MIGVSADELEAQRAFDQKNGLGFPLIADPERKVLDAYGVWGERTRPDGTKTIGVRRWTFLIDEAGTVRKVYQDVTPDSHANFPSLEQAPRVWRQALVGGLDRHGAILTGTPEEVEAATRAAVESVDGRHLIVSAGCALPLARPDANLDAARRAVEP